MAKTSSRNKNLQRTVEQDFVKVDKTTPQERISGRMGWPIRGYRSAQDLAPGKSRSRQKLLRRSGFLDRWVDRAELSKCPRSRARRVSRKSKLPLRSGFLNEWANRARLSSAQNLMPKKCRGSQKSMPQERSPERRCEQSEVLKVTETSKASSDLAASSGAESR